jgi:hypothetical protein
MPPRRHNTQTVTDRHRLLADFERRLENDRRENDFRHRLGRPGSLAWVVHPTADEPGLLAELGLCPDECRSADAFWRFRDSVYFVQLYGSGEGPGCGRAPGLYYRFDREQRQDVFDAFLPDPVITTAAFHCVFALLEALIDQGTVEAARAELADGEGRWLARAELLARLP